MSTMSKIARRWTSRLLIFVLVFMTVAVHVGVVESEAATKSITYTSYMNRGDDTYAIKRRKEYIYDGEEAKGNLVIPLKGHTVFGYFAGSYYANYSPLLTNAHIVEKNKTYTDLTIQPNTYDGHSGTATLTYKSNNNTYGSASRSSDVVRVVAGGIAIKTSYTHRITGSPLGTPIGSIAIPAEGYKFLGWYKNNSTTLVTESIALTREDIDKFAKSTASYYVNTVFTAKFEASTDVVLYHYSSDLSMGDVDISSQNVTKNSTLSDVTATPHAGYHFVNWVDEAGKEVSNKATLKKEIIESKSKDDAGNFKRTAFKAVFEEDKEVVITYNINIKGAGTVKTTSDTAATESTNEEVKPATGTPKGAVVATNAAGYVFQYWTNSIGDIVSYENTLEMEIVCGNSYNEDLLYPDINNHAWVGELVYVDSIFTAHFKKTTDAVLTFKTASDVMGSVKLEGGDALLTLNQPLDKTTGVAQPVTAVANKGYKFKSWTNSANTTEINHNPLTKEDIESIAKSTGVYTADVKFYANFEVSTGTTLTFESTDENQGKVQQGSETKTRLLTQYIETGSADQPVDITAVAEAGYEFEKWTDASGNPIKDADGGDVSNVNPISSAVITKNATDDTGALVDTTFKAVFKELQPVELTFKVDENSHGTVKKVGDTSDTLATTPQSLNPEIGQAVDVTASASKGYDFSNWTMEGETTPVSTEATLLATIIASKAKVDGKYVPKTFTANFTEKKATLTFATDQTQMGSVSPTSITEVGAHTGDAKITDVVATANPGYEFVAWVDSSGTKITDASTSGETAKTLPASEIQTRSKEDGIYVDKTYTAQFKERDAVAITYEAKDEHGELTLTSESVSPASGKTTTHSELQGTTATAKAGYEFVSWTTEDGTVVSEDGKLTKTDIDKFAKDTSQVASGLYVATKFIANFKEKKATITYDVNDTKMGSVQLDGSVFDKDELDVVTGTPKLPTAVANPGYKFKEWQKAGKHISGTAMIDKAIIDSNAKDGNHHYTDTTLTAVFEELKETITYEVQGGHGSIEMTVDGANKSGTTLKEENLLAVTGSATGEVSIVPDAGYELDSWTVGGVTIAVGSDGKLTKALVDANAKDAGIYKTTTFVVRFKEKDAITIQYKVDGKGQVTDPTDASKTATLTSEAVKPATEHAKGSTAKPATGYEFDGWTVNIDSSWSYEEEELTTTEIEKIARKSGAYDAGTNSEIVFTASFTEKQNVDLKFAVDTSGGGTLEGALTQSVEPVTGDSKVSAVTAKATTGYHFVNWTNDKTGDVISGETNAKIHTLTVADIQRIAKSTGEYLQTTFTAHFAHDGDATLTYVSGDDTKGVVNNLANGTNTQPLRPADGVAEAVSVKARTGYRFDKWTVDVNPNWQLTSAQSSNGALSKTNIETAAKLVGGDGNSAFVNAVFTAHFVEKDDVKVTYKVADADTAKGDVLKVGATDKLAETDEMIAPATGEATGTRAVARAGYKFEKWTVDVNSSWELTSAQSSDGTLSKSDIEAAIKKAGADGYSAYETAVFTAHFVEGDPVKIEFKVSEGGSLTGTNPQTPKPISGTVSDVSVKAINSGYVFTGWTVSTDPDWSYVGTAVSGSYILPASEIQKVARVDGAYVDATFTANFEESSYRVKLTFELDDPDSGTITLPEQNLKPVSEEPTEVHAEAADGYHFVKWTVDTGSGEKDITGSASSDDAIGGNGHALSSADIIKYAKSTGAFTTATFKAYIDEDEDVELTFESNEDTYGTVLGKSPQLLAPATGDTKKTEKISSVTAAKKAGYRFINWTHNGNEIIQDEELKADEIKAAAKADTVYVASTFVANFEPLDLVTISFTTNADEWDSNTWGSITGKATQPINPETGTIEAVSADEKLGYEFEKWVIVHDYGETDIPEGAQLDETDIDRYAKDAEGLYKTTTFKAYFVEIAPVTFTYEAGVGGSVEAVSGGTSEDVNPQIGQPQGAIAQPNAGYTFENWEVTRAGYTGTVATATLDKTAIDSVAMVSGEYVETTFKAVFKENDPVKVEYKIRQGDEGRGTISRIEESKRPVSEALEGSEASANMGYLFDGWYDESGTLVSSSETLVPARGADGLNVAATYEARFKLDPAYAPVLEITKKAEPLFAQVGDYITYTITVKNTGFHDATDVTITDTIADGLEFDSCTPTTGSHLGSTVTWTGESIPSGITKTYTVRVKVTDGVGDKVTSGATTATDAGSGSTGTTTTNANIQIIKLDDMAYSVSWSRVTAATESSEREGVYGFIRGNLVEFDVNIINTSDMDLTLDVEDKFAQIGVFSEVQVVDVKINDVSDESYAGYESVEDLTLAAGDIATIRFGANIISNVEEYGEGEIKYDSSEFGDTGWENIATITNVRASKLLDDGSTVTYTKDGAATTLTWADNADGTNALDDSEVSGTVPTRIIDAMVTYSFDVNWADVVPTYRPSAVDVELIIVDEDGNYIKTVEEKTLTAEDRTSSDVWSTTFEPHPAYENVVDIITKATPAVAMAGSMRSGSGSSRTILAGTDDIAEDGSAIDDKSTDGVMSSGLDTDDSSSEDSSKTLATASDASASEAEGEEYDLETSDGTLPDGTLLDDIQVDEGASSSKYLMARSAGLINRDDLGAEIIYAVRVVSEVVEGYTRSEVTSVGEKFEVTEYRPWTPREISTSGIRKDDSRSGSIIVDAKDGTKTIAGSLARTSVGTSTSTGGTTPIGATRNYIEAGSAGAWHVINTAGSAGDSSGATAGTVDSTTGIDSGSVGAAAGDITILSSLSVLDDATDKDIKFMQADGSYLTDDWALISSGLDESGTPTYSWYHFGSDGTLDTGWLLDTTGYWYYLSESTDSSVGGLITGWILDSQDGRWYYLELSTGAMATGWKYIDSKWYYFTEGTPIETWQYNSQTRKWIYKNIEGDRPYSSMYRDEETPDGFVVGEDGELRG